LSVSFFIDTYMKKIIFSIPIVLIGLAIYALAQTTPTTAEYTALAGQKVVLAAAAEGTAPITFYWYKDTSLIGVSDSITFTSISLANAGTYRVTAKNLVGETSSDPIRLIVVTPVAPNKVKITVTITNS